MPIRQSSDKLGHYFRYGNQTKYYFIYGNYGSMAKAYHKALNQQRAIFISQRKR